jgi:hypothetical protein
MMQRAISLSFLAAVIVGCASPAFMTEQSKRSLLAQKCQEKIQPLMKFAVLFTNVPEPDRKVCGCIAQKVELSRVEAIALKPAGEARDSAVGAFLVENAPMIRDCAVATGVLPGRR